MYFFDTRIFSVRFIMLKTLYLHQLAEDLLIQNISADSTNGITSGAVFSAID